MKNEGPRQKIVHFAELQGHTKRSWLYQAQDLRERIYQFDFVSHFAGPIIYFKEPIAISAVAGRLEGFLRRQLGTCDVQYRSNASVDAQKSAKRVAAEAKREFHKVAFGPDVAERDDDLLSYFVQTKTYERVESGELSVIIGPKGSGKTAILRALCSKIGSKHTIVITPEIFATSMLQDVVEKSDGLGDEDRAFVSTWIFTILVEVFKRLSDNPRGVPSNALKRVRAFLRDNADYGELDLFTRFIGYLKRIETVKIGTYELTIKTKMLQELYALAPIYEIVPQLRQSGDTLFILLDELDQGWDNSRHANRFIASLLQAAIKIQGFGLRVRVVAFIRSEIFDLVKDQLDHLDKLRSSMEVLKWSDGELADMVAYRMAHSLRVHYKRTGHEVEVVESLFSGAVDGLGGFAYLLSRTSLRPREVLQFLNLAHRIASQGGRGEIDPRSLSSAEVVFSQWKLEHLCAEYHHIYPSLRRLLLCFRGHGPVLSHASILLIIEGFQASSGDNSEAWTRRVSKEILQLLFDVEFIGIPKLRSARNRSGLISRYEFSFEGASSSVQSDHYLIHPAFWSTLEIESSER